MPELKSQNLKNVFAEHLEIYNQEDQGHTTFKLGWTEFTEKPWQGRAVIQTKALKLQVTWSGCGASGGEAGIDLNKFFRYQFVRLINTIEVAITFTYHCKLSSLP